MALIDRCTVALTLGIAALIVAVLAPAEGAAPGPAPTFALKLFNGKTLRLADLKGTAVVLLFWAVW